MKRPADGAAASVVTARFSAVHFSQPVNGNLNLVLTDDLENVTGGSGADFLYGNGLNNVLRGGPGNAVLRMAQFELAQQSGETVAVFGEVDGIGRGAQDRDARTFQRMGEIEWRLAAILNDHAQEPAVRLLS